MCFYSNLFQVNIEINFLLSGAMLRTVVGEVFLSLLLLLYAIHTNTNFIQPTGTSTKFVNMTERALQHFEDQHGVKFEKITKIPLEGDGTIDKRVERYAPSIAS